MSGPIFKTMNQNGSELLTHCRCPECGAHSISPIVLPDSSTPVQLDGTYFGKCENCGHLVEMDRIDYVTLQQRTNAHRNSDLHTIADWADGRERSEVPVWPTVAALALLGLAAALIYFDRHAGMVALCAASAVCLFWMGIAGLRTGRFVIKKGFVEIVVRGGPAFVWSILALLLGLMFTLSAVWTLLDRHSHA